MPKLPGYIESVYSRTNRTNLCQIKWSDTGKIPIYIQEKPPVDEIILLVTAVTTEKVLSEEQKEVLSEEQEALE